MLRIFVRIRSLGNPVLKYLFIVSVGALFLCTDTVLSAQEVASLCKAGETVVWSCSERGSIYSVCASPDLTKSSGYMQYRAHNPRLGNLEFPKKILHPKGNFEYISSANGDAALEFTVNGVTYSIVDPLRSNSEIWVRNSRQIQPGTKIQCSNSTQSLSLNEIIGLMDRAGLKDK